MLLKNFSSAIQKFAAECTKYEGISKVFDYATFISNYVNTKKVSTDVKQQVANSANSLYRIVQEKAPTAIQKIIKSWMLANIYGITVQGWAEKHKKFTKFAKSVMGYNTIVALATNVKGMVANVTQGEFQNLMHAVGGEHFNMKDYVYSRGLFLYDNTAGLPGKCVDMLLGNRESKEFQLLDFFDPDQSVFENDKNTTYHRNLARRLMSHDITLAGYEVGEYAIHALNMFSILHHIKVYKNGRQINLIDAIKLSKDGYGTASLYIENGVTSDAEGKNQIRMDENDDFIKSVIKEITYVNTRCHGNMNPEDKGEFQRTLEGAFLAQFRQWMIGTTAARFRGKHYDANRRKVVEGFHRTMWYYLRDVYRFNVLGGWFRNTKLNTKGYDSRDKRPLDATQKANLRMYIFEHSFIFSLIVLSRILGSPADTDDYWKRFAIYQTRRLFLDLASQTVPGAVFSFDAILNSPIPASNTMKYGMYILYGLPEIFRATRDKRDDWLKYIGYNNKYIRTLYKHEIPFVRDYVQMTEQGTKQGLRQFNVFNGWDPILGSKAKSDYDDQPFAGWL